VDSGLEGKLCILDDRARCRGDRSGGEMERRQICIAELDVRESGARDLWDLVPKREHQ
jgi:hypothetical protein